MLNGALIGAGNIARNGHLPAYSGERVRDRLRITSVADLCPVNLAAIAVALPGVRTYASPTALLAAEQPDFVDICAPPYAHRAIVEQAAAAGCHILCEKPLATDLHDALAMRDAIAGRGLVAMPCHQYHFAPQWRRLRRSIESGDIGTVRLAMLNVYRVGANPGNDAWMPDWRTHRQLAGGGIVVDHGTHLFYQLHALFGPPAEIGCRIERRLPAMRVDDTATLYLRYPGRLVRIHLTWAASERFSSHRYVGTRGQVACLDDQLELSTAAGRRLVPFGEGLSQSSSHSGWFTPLLAEFAQRIETRNTATDLLDEGVTTAAYTALAYASAAQDGRPLAWREPLVTRYAAAD